MALLRRTLPRQYPTAGASAKGLPEWLARAHAPDARRSGAWLDHVASIGQTNTVAASIRLHYRACPVIPLLWGQASWQFNQTLNPESPPRSSRFHAAQCKVMTRRPQSTAGVGDYENVVA